MPDPFPPSASRRSLLGATALALVGVRAWAQPEGGGAPAGVYAGGTPGPITDLLWQQGMAVHAQAQGGMLGTFEPVGGIGPFSYAFAGPVDGSKYVIQGRGIYAPVTGGVGPADAALPVVVTDGLGQIFRKTITVRKTSRVPYVWCSAASGVWDNLVNPASGTEFGAVAHGYGLGDRVEFSATDDNFNWSPGDPYLHLRRLPAPGEHVLQVTARGSGGAVTQAVTVPVRRAVISPIHFAPSQVSSSLQPGVRIGRALCTTSDNRYAWSLPDDAGGRYQIDPNTGVVTVKGALVAGTDRLRIRCTSGTLLWEDAFDVPVLAGRVLPPEAMTMVVPTTLTNAGWAPRVVGTPQVRGLAGPLTWSLVQNDRCVAMDTGEYSGKIGRPGYRYVIDPATGRVTANQILSAQTDQLTLTCTDGLNTCTRTFAVPVAAAPGRVHHVGRGMAARYGALGHEHIRDIYNGLTGADPAYVGATVYIHWDADPDYYANDGLIGDATVRDPYQGNWRRGISGPITFEGVPSPAGVLPRLGGRRGAPWGGVDWNGEATFNVNNGDVTIRKLHISDVAGQNDLQQEWPRAGSSCIRKNGETYGNLVVEDCWLQACGNGIETGMTTGRLVVRRCVIEGAGAEYQGNGNTHNIYCGPMSLCEVDRLLSRCATSGHLLKSRAEVTTVTNSRFLAGEHGEESCEIDLPEGGLATIDGCVVQRGPNPQSQAAVQFNMEGAGAERHALTITNTTFLAACPDGLRTAGPVAVMQAGIRTKAGGYSTVTLGAGNAFYGFPPGKRLKAGFSGWGGASAAPDDGHDYLPVETVAPVMLGAMPALDFSPPIGVSGFTLPRFPGFAFTADRQGAFENWSGVQMDFGADDIRVAAGAAPGTRVAVVRARGCGMYAGSSARQPDPRIDPFGAGTVYSLIRPQVFYGGQPWAPEGRYRIDAGSGEITVGSALRPGVDFLSVRAVSRGGVVCDRRCYVVVA